MADTPDRIIREEDLPFTVFGKIVRDLEFTFKQKGSGEIIDAVARGTFTGVHCEPMFHSRLFYRKTNSWRHTLGDMTNAELDALPKTKDGIILWEVGREDIEAEGKRSYRKGPVTDSQIEESVGDDVSRMDKLIAVLQAKKAAVQAKETA